MFVCLCVSLLSVVNSYPLPFPDRNDAAHSTSFCGDKQCGTEPPAAGNCVYSSPHLNKYDALHKMSYILKTQYVFYVSSVRQDIVAFAHIYRSYNVPMWRIKMRLKIIHKIAMFEIWQKTWIISMVVNSKQHNYNHTNTYTYTTKDILGAHCGWAHHHSLIARGHHCLVSSSIYIFQRTSCRRQWCGARRQCGWWRGRFAFWRAFTKMRAGLLAEGIQAYHQPASGCNATYLVLRAKTWWQTIWRLAMLQSTWKNSLAQR